MILLCHWFMPGQLSAGFIANTCFYFHTLTFQVANMLLCRLAVIAWLHAGLSSVLMQSCPMVSVT